MSRTAVSLRARPESGVVDLSEFSELVRSRPVALFLDVDGTLLDLAPTPSAV